LRLQTDVASGLEEVEARFKEATAEQEIQYARQTSELASVLADIEVRCTDAVEDRCAHFTRETLLQNDAPSMAQREPEYSACSEELERRLVDMRNDCNETTDVVCRRLRADLLAALDCLTARFEATAATQRTELLAAIEEATLAANSSLGRVMTRLGRT